MITFPPRRTALRSVAAIGAVLIAGSTLAAVPAVAATPSAATTLLSNQSKLPIASGKTSDFDTGAVIFQTELVCGAGNIPNLFITEAGSEVGQVATDGSMDLSNSYGYYNGGASRFTDRDTGKPFRDVVGDGRAAMTVTYYRSSDFEAVPTGQIFEAGKTYSLGLVCNTGGSTQTIQADASGNAVQAWVRIQVDASNGWSVVVPKADTSVALTGAQDGVNGAKLTATVTPAAAAGKVTFTDGTATAEATVVNGVASATIPSLTDGTHNFTATFSAAAGAAFNDSVSAPVEVVISKVKVATTVELTGKAVGYDAAEYTATVKTPTATATAATGVVEFWSAGVKKGEQAVTNGVAVYPVTDLKAGSTVNYTAKFVPAATNVDYTASAETAAVTVAVPALPAQLTAGMAATAGTKYRVEYPAGTFSASKAVTRAAGDTITGTLNGTALTEVAVVAADGSARYIFTVPAAAAAGSAQTLVVTDATSTSTLAFTIAAAAAAPVAVPGAGSAASPAANAAALFRTDWVAAATSSPAALVSVIGTLLALAGASVGGWAIWRRRRSAQA